MRKKKCRLTFPVVMVVSAICYIYFTTIFVFIDTWFGLSTSPGLINALLFSFISAICVFNYVFAIFRDPGPVPSSFTPDIEDSHNFPIQEVKRKVCDVLVWPLAFFVSSPLIWHPTSYPALPFEFLGYIVSFVLLTASYMALSSLGFARNDTSGDLRYCQKCSHYKPPRAHHCRVCKRCVLRMDHHCIWINNCVGHANYKIFFVFVLYAVIACIYSVVLLLGSITTNTAKDESQSEGSSRIIYVMSCLLIFPLTIALGVLLGWHIYLTMQNKTTIEYYEGVRAMWLAEKGGEVYRHPYDIGAFENLTLVLGPNVLCWICPTSGHIGSGLHFPTVYDKLTGPSSE